MSYNLLIIMVALLLHTIIKLVFDYKVKQLKRRNAIMRRSMPRLYMGGKVIYIRVCAREGELGFNAEDKTNDTK